MQAVVTVSPPAARTPQARHQLPRLQPQVLLAQAVWPLELPPGLLAVHTPCLLRPDWKCILVVPQVVIQHKHCLPKACQTAAVMLAWAALAKKRRQLRMKHLPSVVLIQAWNSTTAVRKQSLKVGRKEPRAPKYCHYWRCHALGLLQCHAARVSLFDVQLLCRTVD